MNRKFPTFLRPTIIRDDETMNTISGQKYSLMRAQQLEKEAQGIQLMPNASSPALPEMTNAAELLKNLQEEMRLKQATPEKKTTQQKNAQHKVKKARQQVVAINRRGTTGGDR